jgi:His-Xaa-Ser system protein HxsD
LRAVYSCAYLFLEKAYIFLEGDPKKVIIVNIKAKTGNDAGKISDEFLNELLNASLRCEISRENKKIREFIVGTALLSVSQKRTGETGDNCGCNDTRPAGKDRHRALNWGRVKNVRGYKNPAGEGNKLSDPLGIAVPWEEKYGKKNIG